MSCSATRCSWPVIRDRQRYENYFTILYDCDLICFVKNIFSIKTILIDQFLEKSLLISAYELISQSLNSLHCSWRGTFWNKLSSGEHDIAPPLFNPFRISLRGGEEKLMQRVNQFVRTWKSPSNSKHIIIIPLCLSNYIMSRHSEKLTVFHHTLWMWQCRAS